MKKMLVFIICISCMSALLLCLGCGGGKDISGKYVTSDGSVTLELTHAGNAKLTSGAVKTEVLYKVEGNTVKLFAKGKEKIAVKLEIRNKDLVEPKFGYEVC